MTVWRKAIISIIVIIAIGVLVGRAHRVLSQTPTEMTIYLPMLLVENRNYPTPPPRESHTPTVTPSASPTIAASVTETALATATITPTVEGSPTLTSTTTASPSPTATLGNDGSPTASPSPTATLGDGETPTVEPSPTSTATNTQTATETATSTPTSTPTATETVTATPTQTATATTTGTPTEIPSPTVSPTALVMPNSPVGLQLLGSQHNPDLRTLAVNTGAKWAHIYLYWSVMEPTNTTPEFYNWHLYDEMLAELSSQGFLVMVNFHDNPLWAASRSRGPIDKVSLDEFEEFIGAVAERYSKPPYNLHFYQFYLEPDGWASWGGHGDKYAQMLQRAHGAIRNVDPNGRVILGGLAYEDWNGCNPSPCFDLNFLPDIAAAGGAPYIDLLNFNYYHVFSFRYWPRNIMGKALAIRNLMPAEYRNKPIICSEVGDIYYQEGQDSAAMQERQARFVVQGYAHAMAASYYSLDMPSCLWFSFETHDAGTVRFGMLDQQNTPLPSYRAMQVFNQLMPVRPSAVNRLDDYSINREGYVFQLPPPYDILYYILWMEDPTRSSVYDIPATHVQVISIYGEGTEILDGQTGDLDQQVNGKIQLPITGAPNYIRVLSQG